MEKNDIINTIKNAYRCATMTKRNIICKRNYIELDARMKGKLNNFASKRIFILIYYN